MTKLTDQSPMPFGKYKGQKLEDVPASYLIWLHDEWHCTGPIKEYIVDNRDVLDKQVKESV